MWKSKRLRTDMSWFRVQLFCLTGNSPHTSNVTSLNLSFLICEMGPVLPVQLVVRLRDNQYYGPAQCLVHRSYPPGAEKSCLHVYKWWSRMRRVLHKRCKQSLRNPTGREINPGWFHARVYLGRAWKEGQDINRPLLQSSPQCLLLLFSWYFWTVMLEKTLESALDCKEIKPVNPKGNQS